MNYTNKQIIDALVNEWIYLCHDDPWDDDLTPEQYRTEMEQLTTEELIIETGTDEGFTLDDFMDAYA